MKYTVDKTDKILYTGDNIKEVVDFFKKWEKQWGFNTKLFMYPHSSYEECMRGNGRYDLLVNYTAGLPITSQKKIISFNNTLSFHKLNNGEIVLIMD